MTISETARTLDWEALAEAKFHPTQTAILGALLNGEDASPVQLSHVLDEPLGNVSYHVKILREKDLIELVKTRPIRGAIEHIYRIKGKATVSNDTYDLPREEQWAILRALEKVIADAEGTQIPKRAVEEAQRRFALRLEPRYFTVRLAHDRGHTVTRSSVRAIDPEDAWERARAATEAEHGIKGWMQDGDVVEEMD